MMIKSSTLIMALVAMISTSAIQTYAGESSDEPVEHVVEIMGFKFNPASIKASAGDTVTWINRDIVPHTATAYDKTMDTGQMNGGESKSVTLTQNVSLKYFCLYHPKMQGDIVMLAP